ncbi:hypothetical protein [Aliiglaciecola sp. LCG003]|uniref:hypothetical protein n=1 Tax=Aliiglaciecola sp. LCG003 TaxID=3053655 RepID=UPI0025733217|nr:hypothetical protein [Aliiglaciecola sp. LCG003]WJG10459.1 hypothetical protein QR722_05310 [Aliiglaciecola sp. LCG003]
MLQHQEYWFNFQPNLQYYPGTSIAIMLPLALFGEDFWFLQGFIGVISILGIWIISRYFSVEKYGVIGFFTPFFVLTSSIFMLYFYALISDSLFLTVSMAALLCWRKYDMSGQRKFLFLCCALVAFSSLVRLQGLFFCAALGLALLIHAFQHNRDTLKLSISKMLVIGGLVCLPFILWTARNYFAHTPDTFNMANGYFFGLKGLSIYAKGLPGDASAESVEAAWQFPLLRTSMFFGALFESWYGGLSTLNRHVITVVMLVLVALGLGPWAKRANKLELLYVGLSMAFIGKDILLTKTLHIVYRYWIPMLPFIIVMMGFGIYKCVNFAWLGKLKRPAQTGALLLVSALLVLASPNLLRHVEQTDKFRDESSAISALKGFVDIEIPKNAVVATVDWGVLPHTLQRRSIPLLNDPNNQQSIERMLKYNTEYLVTFGKFARMNDPALNMVDRFPKVFNKIFETYTQQPNTAIEIYRVDLAQLNEHFIREGN